MNDDAFPYPGVPAPPATEADDDSFRVLSVAVFEPQPWALGLSPDTTPGFPVFISQAAVINLLRHGEQGLLTEREVAGALVGAPGYDPHTGLIFTRIIAALPAAGYASEYEVEIAPEEWSRLATLVQEEEPYRGRSLLCGWYHSHPTFDAYLSALDEETQRQFFPEIWQIAIVVSPLRRQIRAFHGAYGGECPLYVDPAETGGVLVPVVYEVTPGAVSTPVGIEWLAPPAVADAGSTPLDPAWPEDAAPGAWDEPPTEYSAAFNLVVDPPESDPPPYAVPGAAWRVGPLDLSPLALGLILLAFVLGMAVMLVLMLALRPLPR